MFADELGVVPVRGPAPGAVGVPAHETGAKGAENPAATRFAELGLSATEQEFAAGQSGSCLLWCGDLLRLWGETVFGRQAEVGLDFAQHAVKFPALFGCDWRPFVLFL